VHTLYFHKASRASLQQSQLYGLTQRGDRIIELFARLSISLLLRRGRIKEQPCVHVGSCFAYDLLQAHAVTPPALGIIVRIRDRNDADCNVLPESFPKEDAGAMCGGSLIEKLGFYSGIGLFAYRAQTTPRPKPLEGTI
jgi:hypothetical protein